MGRIVLESREDTSVGVVSIHPFPRQRNKRMRKSVVLFVLLGCVAGAMSLVPPVQGVTLEALGFAEMVQQASVIVHAQVTKMESFWSAGAEITKRTEVKESQAPARRTAADARAAGGTPETPREVGIEPGRMLFTKVSLAVLSSLKGTAGQTVELVVAGGSLDGRHAIIPGMPEFQNGGKYMVFLRPGYTASADPIVGVNQGFFQVVQDPESGQEVVLNAKADYVLGIEDNRVVTRHNPQARERSGRPRLQLTAPPVPDTPGVQSETSQAAARYWNATEAPLTVRDLAQTIRQALGR
jgi:hypothetical protein